MAKRRAAIRREQERQRTERALAEQRDKERLARMQRDAEAKGGAGQVEPIPRARKQQQAAGKKQAKKGASLDLEAKRAAAQAMWNRLGEQPEWSEESEDVAPQEAKEDDAYLKALEQKATDDAALEARRAAARAAWNDARSEIEWAEE